MEACGRGAVGVVGAVWCVGSEGRARQAEGAWLCWGRCGCVSVWMGGERVRVRGPVGAGGRAGAAIKHYSLSFGA